MLRKLANHTCLTVRHTATFVLDIDISW